MTHSLEFYMDIGLAHTVLFEHSSIVSQFLGNSDIAVIIQSRRAICLAYHSYFNRALDTLRKRSSLLTNFLVRTDRIAIVRTCCVLSLQYPLINFIEVESDSD